MMMMSFLEWSSINDHFKYITNLLNNIEFCILYTFELICTYALGCFFLFPNVLQLLPVM